MTAEDAARPPEVIRRREVRHTSARSLLMTVLGEFVLPAGRPVWTWMLVDTLAGFGVTEKSARQALARAAAEGLLVSERVGRRTRWELTPSARRLLSEGARRIYEFGRSERGWDGRWLLLLVSVPEAKRDLRHRLRTRLSWAGFGSPEAGVWISPHLSREAEALEVVKELGLAACAMSFTAAFGRIGGQDEMVSRAWDLTGLEERYEAFLADFGGPGAGRPGRGPARPDQARARVAALPVPRPATAPRAAAGQLERIQGGRTVPPAARGVAGGR